MCSPNFRGTKWVWTIAKGQLSMPRWKGQKWIQNDTEQTEQTNRPSFWDANCRAGSSDRGQYNRMTSPSKLWNQWKFNSINLRTPTLIPPIHLPLRGPRFEPKDCRCEKICHWNHFSGSHDTQLTLLTVKIHNQYGIQHDTTWYNHGNGRESVVWATCKIWGPPGAIWIKQVDLRMWWWCLWYFGNIKLVESQSLGHTRLSNLFARPLALKRSGGTIFSVPDLN